MRFLSKATIGDYESWHESVQTEGGVALIDKDKEWTSFDVVAKLRNLFGIKKVGHAGTLDPNATGLLILCFGKGTKQVNTYQAAEKNYRALIKLGATTKTDDAEAEEENICSTEGIDREKIEASRDKFLGNIDQIPPMYSAIKVKGQRLYKLARKDIQIELEPRRVEVMSIDILDVDVPEFEVDIRCSKGTYIRSIARDWGKELGCGGYLKELRRTGIGEYRVEDALKVSEIIDRVQGGK